MEQTDPPAKVASNVVLGAWLPIAERLPPAGAPVLICSHDGTVCVAQLDYEPKTGWVWWDAVGFGGYEWEWNWETNEKWKGATHWMPLPAPPQSA